MGCGGVECLRGGGGGATGRGHLAGERREGAPRERPHGDIRLSKELAKTVGGIFHSFINTLNIRAWVNTTWYRSKTLSQKYSIVA